MNQPPAIEPVARMLLRREELSESLGVSPRTLQDWEDKFGLPVIRVGGLVRYSPEAVQQWIRQQPGGEIEVVQ